MPTEFIAYNTALPTLSLAGPKLTITTFTAAGFGDEVLNPALIDIAVVSFSNTDFRLVDGASGLRETRMIGTGLTYDASGITGGTATALEFRNAGVLIATMTGLSEDAVAMVAALDAASDGDWSLFDATFDSATYGSAVFDASAVTGNVTENLYSSGPVEMIGALGENRFTGGPSSDILTGNQFSDWLTGGGAADLIDVGAGDGALDRVRGTLGELDGDEVIGFGAEDRIVVLDALPISRDQITFDGDDLIIGSVLDGGETARISLTGFDRTGLAVDVLNYTGDGFDIVFTEVKGEATIEFFGVGQSTYFTDISIARQVLEYAGPTVIGGGASLALIAGSTGVLSLTGAGLGFVAGALTGTVTGFSVIGGAASGTKISGLNETGAAIQLALLEAAPYSTPLLDGILSQYRMTFDGSGADPFGLSVEATDIIQSGLLTGVTIIGGEWSQLLEGSSFADVIYAYGAESISPERGADVIFLDASGSEPNDFTDWDQGADLDGDTIYGFGLNDTIRILKYISDGLVPSVLSFADGVLSIDINEDGISDADIMFPDLPVGAIWVATDEYDSAEFTVVVSKGDLLIEQFVPGTFQGDVLPILQEAVEGELFSQSDSLLVFTTDTVEYGVVEMRVFGSGLSFYSDEYDYYFSGDATGAEILSDGVNVMSVSGYQGTARNLYGDLYDLPYYYYDWDEIFKSYTVTWDASATGGRALWDGPESPFGVTLIGGPANDFFYAHDGDQVFPGTNRGFDGIVFTGGDITADLSAAADEPLSYYELWFQYDENFSDFDQGVVATIGLTEGTVEYGNAGDRGTATLLSLDAPTGSGGFTIYTGAGDDVVSVQNEADLYSNYITYGGDNSFTGGLQFDRLTVRAPGGVTHRIDGYGVGGFFGTAVDAAGGVTAFSAVDQLHGSSGDDTFFGGVGDDYFITEAGNDVVYAGDGFDFVRYNRSGVSSMAIDLEAETAVGTWSGAAFTDTLVDVEYVRGTVFDDQIRGSAAAERLEGYYGADVIDGRFGTDLLIGGAGADLIRMGGADDASADGDADVASGDLASLNGDTILQIGAEDAIFVIGGALTDAQVRLTDGVLSIDGDNDGTFETVLTVSGPAIAGATPVLAYAEDLTAPGSDDVYNGTSISFAPPVSSLTAIGEVVRLTVGTSWQTLTFANTYTDAVVFALSPSLNEAESAATRFRNVSATGAEIKLQETKKIIDPATGLQEFNTSGHVDETVTLLVLEKGIHTLEDGSVIQVGEIDTNKLYVKGFENVSFAESFASTPTILSQVQTNNGTDFIISRQRNPDASGFELTMQEEQADNLNHATETVGWFAVEHGGGTLSEMDWQAGSSAQNVNGKLTNVSFNEAFATAPLVVASLASYNGTDTSSPRIGSVGTNGFTAMALEDQSYDLETFHGYEIIDWIGFSNEGTIYEAAAPIGTKIAEAGIASVSSTPVSVTFTSDFVNPVVIATITTTVDAGAAVARISNVTATGFDLRVQETDNLDGIHGAETVSWVVVEAGTWVLADGTMIEAGLSDVTGTTRQGFTSLTFDAGFSADPAVLSQTQTENDAAFVKTRMDGINTAGFSVALEEEEAASWGAHGTETVGWIAVDKGAASDADAFVFEAGDISNSHVWAAETFTGAFTDTPGVVAGMASFNANDTAAAHVRGVTGTGFEVHVEEDTSLNPEITHGVETFHWIAFNGVGELYGNAFV